MLDVICISSDDDDDDKLDTSTSKKDAKNDEEYADGKTYSGPMRARLLPARRGRNIERRKASTKRWVERKKALIAATGENVSDTDSIASDDVQLSPVQKARAKTNADKETETQKKISRVLKNLEINLTEKYTAFRDKDTDSDTRRTRSISKESYSSTSQPSNKHSLVNQVSKKNIAKRTEFSLDSSMEGDKSLLDVTLDDAEKSKTQVDDQTFTPCSLKSELMVGDTTYAVTSTLVLVDPSNVNKEGFNNLTKELPKSLSPDENNWEKNTDIIDAVQLRRINPVAPNANNKPNGKFVERCLNIEVEASELEVLKHLQYELADFVEREMKHKLFGTSDSVTKTDKTNSVTYLHQKLDQKLKEIVEIAIKKNIESSFLEKKNDACDQISTRFSPTSAKSAMNSPKYQPKVLIKRLDVTKESKHYNINNAYVLMQTTPSHKLTGPSSVTTRHKRQSVPPVRYGEYNYTTTLDSDFDMLDEDAVQKKLKTINSRASGNPVTRQSTIPIKKSLGKKQDNQKVDYEETNKIEDAITENHICGVCGLTFHTRKDVEAHVRTHKLISGATVMQIVLQNENTTPTPPKTRQSKQKVMRCKRCHEIVQARLVKTHVCKTALHKCYVCDSMFRTKNLLAKHLESHDHSEFNIVNAIGNKKFNNADAKMLKIISTPQKNQAQETETATKTSTASEKNDIQSDKITSTGVKLDSTENIVKKPKETYTCFVCDKIFTDEEILKDHLQKHCDDLSEGEQSNNKEQYLCAICSKTLESDQALEEHVGKHLFDDEDDNPNLISIDQGNENNDKSRETETYQCGQCSETFDSEVLLEMHMQAHEEEVAIAEWEKQGMKVYQYQCMLCEELFNTEEELTQHLDIHNANAHVCQLCDKPFRTLEDLQEHVATH